MAKTKIPSIDDLQVAAATAAARREQAHAEAGAAGRRLAEIRQLLNPRHGRVHGEPPPDRIAVLTAIAHEGDAQRSFAESELAAAAADRAADEALAELRHARRAEILPRHEKAYQAAVSKLAYARVAIDALAAIEEELNAIGGDVGPAQLAVGWNSLRTSADPSRFEPFFEAWQAFALREHGYDVNE